MFQQGQRLDVYRIVNYFQSGGMGEIFREKEIMLPSSYLSTTWYDPRAEVRPSPIQGNGMFASQPIQAGEIVVRIGGTVMTEEEFRVYISKVSRYNAVQIGEKTHRIGSAASCPYRQTLHKEPER